MNRLGPGHLQLPSLIRVVGEGIETTPSTSGSISGPPPIPQVPSVSSSDAG
jgi:hypothetical protein